MGVIRLAITLLEKGKLDTANDSSKSSLAIVNLLLDFTSRNYYGNEIIFFIII